GNGDPAPLPQGHVVGPRPVAEDRLHDRGLVLRLQAGIDALVAGRRRAGRRRLLRRLLRPALRDPLLVALELLTLAPHLVLLATQLGELLLLGQAALLLGLFLALALGQVDLLLAALRLGFALGGLARDRVAAHLFLVHGRRLGHLHLRGRLRLHGCVFGQRHRDRLRLGRR